MTSAVVSRAVERHFDPSKNLVLPNCCTGVPWEADLFVVRPSGWAEEVEIKVSVADFRREFTTKEEKHQHLQNGFPTRFWRYTAEWKAGEEFDPENPLHIVTRESDGSVYAYEDHSKIKAHVVKRFWYAMPAELAEKLESEIPAYAGLIVVVSESPGSVRIRKEAPALKHCRKVTEEERMKLYRAAYYRFWELKREAFNRSQVAA